jgi:hypothetical protein
MLKRPAAMTETAFPPASAGARLIRSALLVLGGHARHHLGRVAPLLNQLRHRAPGRRGVFEEELQPCAEVSSVASDIRCLSFG